MPAKEEAQSSLSLHPNIVSHPAHHMLTHSISSGSLLKPTLGTGGNEISIEFYGLNLITKSNWESFLFN